MIVKYKTYENYSLTEIDVLKEIPSHWKVLKGQFIFKVINERSKTGKELLLSVSEKKGVTPRSEANVTMFMAESYIGYKLCEPGDLVINSLWAWSKGLGFSEYKGIISTAYSVYRPNHKKFDYRFLHYLLRTKRYVDQFKIYSKGIWTSRLQLHDWTFLRIPIAFPQKDEQTAIANFLDHKTAQIDRYIQLKEKTIALLQERKAAIINQAVTKGLDPAAPMRDSGIEWLGEIPAHWEVKKLRYLGQCQNGISQSAEYFGSGFPFVSYGDVYKNFELPFEVEGLANSSVNDRKQYSVEEGDIFFTRTSETIEEIGFTATCMRTIENAVFAGFLIRFRAKKKFLNKRFSKYYFRSDLHRAFFVKEMNLVTRASLSQELLKRLPVLLPNLDEQKRIAKFIENKIKRIEAIIENTDKEIIFIKEYRESLISAAVTGKIDVREYDLTV